MDTNRRIQPRVVAVMGGAAWGLLFAFIGHVTAPGEEEHLLRQFGEAYREY